MKSCMMSNYLQRDGFVMVSNLLITYQSELGITDKELAFIVKVTKHKENYKLHDSQLDPAVSARTLQRYRKSLSDKGFLTYKVWKCTDDKGHIYTEGITYDFSALEEKLQAISNDIAERKESQINKEAENYIIEFGELSPMAKFLNDWKNHYGDNYRISPVERNWYNNLSEEEQSYVGRIFEYCEENKLFKQISPRLALFMKTKTRWDALKVFCEETYFEEEVEYHEDTRTEKEIMEDEIEEAREKVKNADTNIERTIWEGILKAKLKAFEKMGEQSDEV